MRGIRHSPCIYSNFDSKLFRTIRDLDLTNWADLRMSTDSTPLEQNSRRLGVVENLGVLQHDRQIHQDHGSSCSIVQRKFVS